MNVVRSNAIHSEIYMFGFKVEHIFFIKNVLKTHEK